jgi:prepilin-type N-terminal cleavage/methylation domain-containing protein
MRIGNAKPNRSGVTLIEVLVAIFVMAIGLMALLTLFPLGALEMAQAIKDQRAADTGWDGNSALRAYWKASVATNPTDPDRYLDLPMLNPSGPDPQPPPGLFGPPAGGSLPDRTGNDGPSHVVMLDPFGKNQYGNGASQYWVAGLPGGTVNGAGLRRVNSRPIMEPPAGFNSRQLTLTGYTNLNDIYFDENGLPNGSPFNRELRYSYSVLLQRPQATEPKYVNATIVVYTGRTVQFTADATPTGENWYPVPPPQQGGFTQGSTSVVLIWNNNTVEPKPTIRRGGWVLDATMMDPANPNDPTYSPHAYFYRVVDVSEGNGTTTLELQTPAVASSPSQGGIAFILDHVSEVIIKPTMGP